MDKSRIAIIVLVLIAVVFAVGIGVGISQDDKAGENNITADSDESKVEGALEKVPDFFSYLSRETKLTTKDFVNSQAAATLPAIGFGSNARVIAQIKPSDDNTRKAFFKLVSGASARIQYVPAGIPDEIKDQRTRDRLLKENWIDLTASNTDKCDKRDESCKPLTIFKKGGSLEFTCKSDTPCRVELQK
jgi:hypothetical protein